MKISITVHGSPSAGSAAHSALRFTEAALAAGHTITRVFFYQEGIQSARASPVLPQDELDLLPRWVAVKAQHNLELTVCIAAALRRGLLNDEEAQRYERSAADIHPDFEIVGLGQLVSAFIDSDRSITFAA